MIYSFYKNSSDQFRTFGHGLIFLVLSIWLFLWLWKEPVPWRIECLKFRQVTKFVEETEGPHRTMLLEIKNMVLKFAACLISKLKATAIKTGDIFLVSMAACAFPFLPSFVFYCNAYSFSNTELLYFPKLPHRIPFISPLSECWL